MRLLAALVLPPLLAVCFAYTAERVVGGPPPPQLRAEGLVWGKRTFATRADFARWLQAHGRNYDTWVARHPLPKVGASNDDRSWAGRLTAAYSRVAFVAVTLGAVAAIGLVILRRRRFRRRRLRLSAGRAVPWLGSSYSRAHSATVMAWHDHPDLAWYLAGVALVAGAALVVASWG